MVKKPAKVYHYANLKKSGAILGKPRLVNEIQGLDPRSATQKGFNEYGRAIFALLEPQPESWIKNPIFNTAWYELLYMFDQNETHLLLEIEVSPNAHDIFVADRGHNEAFLGRGINIPSTHLHESKAKTSAAYIASRIPYWGYIESAGGHLLPEVVIHNPVPIERVKVSTEQPMLERALQDRFLKPYFASLILNGHAAQELIPWRTKYEESNEPLEQAARSC